MKRQSKLILLVDELIENTTQAEVSIEIEGDLNVLRAGLLSLIDKNQKVRDIIMEVARVHAMSSLLGFFDITKPPTKEDDLNSKHSKQGGTNE